MANLYRVVVKTSADKEVKVVAASPEEAQAKLSLAEGEVVASVEDQGEVVV